MQKALFFSGLGADERIFKKLKIEGWEHFFVQWIDPKAGETLADYSKRLIESQFVFEQKDKLLFIGVSFGGMVATEAAKSFQPQKLIVFSSAKCRAEIPLVYRLAGLFRLHRLAPIWFLKKANRLTFWLFGVQKKEDQQLLTSILNETDGRFLKWAINAILFWDNKKRFENSVHIHGTADRILTKPHSKDIISIESGGHLMVLTEGEKINSIIEKLMKTK